MGAAESKARAKSYRLHNQLLERPGPPGKPLLVPSDKRSPEPDVVTIRWAEPLYDGGAPITGYLVEHRRTGSPHWVRSAPQLVAVPELTLAGLEPGWRYQFRVSAQNAAGLSDPGELSDLLTVTLQRTAASAPIFVKELKDTVALENEKAELSVQVRGTPTPTVSWFKDGVEIFSSRSYRVVTDNEISTLVIYQAALSDEGEVKCSATNRVGYAVTRAKLIIEAPPSIRLPRQYEEGLLFEKDEVIRLKVSVAGRPVPVVSWFLNGEPVPGGGRYEAGHSERYATLRVGEARREDRGEYQVRAVNRLGEDVASFLVTVADRPMPPGRAKVVMTLGRSVTISWSAPEDDGGCKIGNYIVEYFRVGWNMWLKAATCRQLTTTLGDLIEGSEYKFRVKAENPYGVSDPSSESDKVFIPDPKRGLLEPPEHTGEETMDIWMEDKKRPVSPSQTIEEQYGERKTKKKRGPMVPPQSPKPEARGLLVPSDKHSRLSEDSMSPPASPENPPIVPPKRRGKVERVIEKDIIEEKEMARRQEEKRKVEQFKKLEEKRQAEEARKAEEQKRAEEKKKGEEKKKENLRSVPMSPQSPRMQRDRFHGSSELMLVLLPHSRATTEERETTQSKKELFESTMELEGNDIAPPMSLSAPELGSGDPPEMPRVRAAFSSTELLHERAMARFYQDIEQEEAETSRRRGSVQRRRSFGSRQRDGLEKTASLQDIVSSMKSLNELVERKIESPKKSPEKSLITNTTIAKSERITFMGDSIDSVLSTDERKKSLVQQTSEEDMEYEISSTDEEEEDEYDEEEDSIVDEEGEEEIEEEEEEDFSMYGKRGSLYTSESEDERFYYSLEEDKYHPMSINVKYNEDSLISAYEGRGPLILPSLPQTTGPSQKTESLPSPSTSNEGKLKPILKKPTFEANATKISEVENNEHSQENTEKPSTRSLASPEKRFEPNFSAVMPKPILKVRDHSQERLSPSFQRKGAPVAVVEAELNLASSRNDLDEGSDYESNIKKKQVRIEEPEEKAARVSPEIKPDVSNTINTRENKDVTTKPAVEPPKQQDEPRKRGPSLEDEAEAAKVLISHYSEIVAEYGRGRKPNKPLYLDYEALKAAAEEEEKNVPVIPDIVVNEPSESLEPSNDVKNSGLIEIEKKEFNKVIEIEEEPKPVLVQPEVQITEPIMKIEELSAQTNKLMEVAKSAVHFETDVPEKQDILVVRRDKSLEVLDGSVDWQNRLEERDPVMDNRNRTSDRKNMSTNRRDVSLDRRGTSAGRRDTSMDRRTTVGDRRDSSRDRRERAGDTSVDRRDTTVNRRDTSMDRRDTTVNKRDTSMDRRDTTLNKRDTSMDRRDTTVYRRDTSMDRRDTTVNRRDTSMDRRDITVNRRDTSIDRRNTTGNRRDTSVDRRETSTNRRDTTVKIRDRSVDRRDMSVDRQDKFVRKRDASEDKRDRFVDRRDRSTDRRDRSVDRTKMTGKRSPSPWKIKDRDEYFQRETSEIARTPSPLYPGKYKTPEQTVHSFFDFLMDFSLFLLACWLYLFKDERLSIPVLCLMIYRQANEAFQRKMEALREKTRRLMFWKRKL